MRNCIKRRWTQEVTRHHITQHPKVRLENVEVVSIFCVISYYSMKNCYFAISRYGLMAHVYASDSWVIMGSGNDLSSVRNITWTNTDFLSGGLSGINFGKCSFNWRHMQIISPKWQRRDSDPVLSHLNRLSTSACHWLIEFWRKCIRINCKLKLGVEILWVAGSCILE